MTDVHIRRGRENTNMYREKTMWKHRKKVTIDKTRKEPSKWKSPLMTPEINFYCLSLPICGMLLRQPLQLIHTNSQRSYQSREAFFFFLFWLGNTVSVLEGYFEVVPVKKNPNFDIVFSKQVSFTWKDLQILLSWHDDHWIYFSNCVDFKTCPSTHMNTTALVPSLWKRAKPKDT